MPANAQIYTDALKTYTAAFFAGMGEDQSDWRDLIHELPGDASPKDVLIFLSMSMDLPRFRDRRQYFEVVFHKLELETDEHRKGFKVMDADFLQDRWGMYARAAREMGRSVPIARNRMSWAMMVHGFSGRYGLAYDGQFFFDENHRTLDGHVQRNAWDLAFTPENYDRLYEALETMRLPNGELAFGSGEIETRVWCGPKYRARVHHMFELPHDGNNPRYKQSEYKIVPQLTDAYQDYWFLQAMIEGESRPLVFKEDRPTEFVEQTAPESNAQFEYGQRRYGMNTSHGFAYGRYEVMQGSTGLAA